MAPASMKDKVIAITGGAGGIGFALAKLLSAEGAVVALADSSTDALDAAAKELGAKGAKVMATQLDVRSAEQVDTWVREIVSAFGRLDGAANLAGVLRLSGPIWEVKNDEFEFVMGINVMGVVNCMRAQTQAMLKAGKGSIVNAASVAGLKAAQSFSAYGASKHAVVGITRATAVECGPKGIRVNCICPAILRTNMVTEQENILGRALGNPKERIPLGYEGQAEDAAKLIRFLLSDDSSYMNGNAESLDGGYLVK